MRNSYENLSELQLNALRKYTSLLHQKNKLSKKRLEILIFINFILVLHKTLECLTLGDNSTALFKLEMSPNVRLIKLSCPRQSRRKWIFQLWREDEPRFCISISFSISIDMIINFRFALWFVHSNLKEKKGNCKSALSRIHSRAFLIWRLKF